MTPLRRPLAVALLGVVAVVTTASSAASTASTSTAAVGLINTATRDAGELQVVFQASGVAPGVTIDPGSVRVTLGGQEVIDPEVRQLEGGTSSLTRTTVLAIDTSKSMAGDKFSAAQDAATAFVAALPPDVKVGVVTFADETNVVLRPTDAHPAIADAIAGLTLSAITGTALYDGSTLAVDETGDADVRSVLLLSDGNEYGNSSTNLPDAVDHATKSGVRIDGVYIGPEAVPPPELGQLVQGTGGRAAKAGTDELAGIYTQFAQDLRTQISITGRVPAGVPRSAQVVVQARAGGQPVHDSAVTIGSGPPTDPLAEAGPQAITPQKGVVPDKALPALLAMLFLGLLAIALIALSSSRRDEAHGRLRRRLSLYTLSGRAPVKQQETTTALGSSQVARSAVELAGKVVDRRDFEADLGLRLEAAGVPLRPAEWMLIHLGIATGTALILLLISGGRILPTVLGLAAGLGLPWAYLLVKESRRTSAFLAQLPDTLQLIAGSLSAGYSMPQAMDTVVREDQQPISGEFNRALVEARLGVPIEEAMEGVAERMKSKDFAWVVMAIRIQREVGGNLAELLTTVSGTLRERETLRRQVKVLSAEGRLSGWILGLLPPVFALYLVLARPSYLEPLVSELLGWVLLGIGAVLLVIGTLWMRKAVKVEV